MYSREYALRKVSVGIFFAVSLRIPWHFRVFPSFKKLPVSWCVKTLKWIFGQWCIARKIPIRILFSKNEPAIHIVKSRSQEVLYQLRTLYSHYVKPVAQDRNIFILVSFNRETYLSSSMWKWTDFVELLVIEKGEVYRPWQWNIDNLSFVRADAALRKSTSQVVPHLRHVHSPSWPEFMSGTSTFHSRLSCRGIKTRNLIILVKIHKALTCHLFLSSGVLLLQ